MTKIIAHIPTRTLGKTTIPAHDKVFTCDENGQWSHEFGNVQEADVIDLCKKATNWRDIQSKHFRMEGFHN